MSGFTSDDIIVKINGFNPFHIRIRHFFVHLECLKLAKSLLRPRPITSILITAGEEEYP